ncbi:hypothetical protein [Kibdelosporangium phytohabitans]|uniref:Uncharacterized protein n=1 Tax=Kibdelosporangium phytohabitans TaxID=860235 RepID=A0A0N9HW73_9PSEU|nr:hypothetical protein [Kibdelosporangium phytohabitans]ALG07673.1 hypothetical protein AOZ06_12825 [Kibdelosporangium phytohabitans]ALG07729.1 hypothetical protein AOZ06_13145 [Kibdelosporangium phytohabitans]MBE1471366.1 putative nucleic acid-binding Zn-ribbon protein [Kibdelosporangium phytohabitans]
MALKTGEIRALITGDYTSFKRATTAAKREAKDTRDELSKPITLSGNAKPLLTVLGGLPAAAAVAGAGMAAGLAAPALVIAGIGAAALASNEQVRTAFSGMAEHVSTSVRSAAEPMVPYLVGIANRIEQRFNKLRPQMESAFRDAGPLVGTFADGLLDFAENAMPGATAAVQKGQPAFDGLRSFLAQSGRGVSEMMLEWADSSDTAGAALDDLGGVVQDALRFIGRLTSLVADEFGPAFDDVKGIFGDAEDAIMDVAGGTLPLLGSAVDVALDGLGALLGVVAAVAEGFGDLPAPMQAALLGVIAWRAMQSSLIGEHASLGERLAQPWRQFGDEVKLQTALAAASGHTNLGSLAASMAVVESRVPFIHRMAEAYRNASQSVVEYVQSHRGVAESVGAVDHAAGAVTRLGGAAVGTAAALGSGLRSAAAGLVGVLGGPWGVALAAGAALLGLWASKQQEAAARQRESAQAASAYARALRESNGVITASIRQQAADNAEKRGALKTAEELGLSLSEVTSAVLGEGAALDSLRARLQDTIKAHTEQVAITEGAKSGITKYKEQLDPTGERAKALLDIINVLNGEWAAGTSEARRMAEATGEASSALSQAPAATGPMAEALKKLSDESASAEDKISALKSALDELAGRRHTVEEANQGVNDTLRDMKDAFKAAADEAKTHKTGLLDSTGAINTVTAAGSALQDKVMQLSDAYRQQYSAVFEAAQAQGKSLPEAAAAAAAASAGTREALIKTAQQFVGTREKAEELAARYDLLPTAASTAILQPGMEASISSAGILRDKVIAVPDSKTIIVSSTTPQQIALLENMGFKVQTLPSGHVVITSNASSVNAEINQLTETRRMSILIDYRTSGIPNAAKLAKDAVERASGGVMEYYAAGGMRSMSASHADIVGSYRRTGVKRIIGDNAVADESFIPLQRNNARAQLILDETLRRMRPELFQRPMVDAPWSGGAWGIGTLDGNRAGSSSRTTTITINGHSSNDIVRRLDEERRREELLYGA